MVYPDVESNYAVVTFGKTFATSEQATAYYEAMKDCWLILQPDSYEPGGTA